MRITELLKKESIKLGVKVADKNAAIDKLISLMDAGGRLNSTQGYKEGILAREALGSTAIGEGIAIPHAKVEAVKEPGLAAMVVPEGVDYEAFDGSLANLIFMIAAPAAGDDVHLQALSRLSTLLMNPGFKESLIAAKDFGLHKDQMVVGNGASELIKSLMEQLPGKIGVVKPTFEEYPNRKNAEDVIAFLPSNEDYSYSAEDLMNYYADKDIKTLLLINPDNPSGNYIPKKDVLLLAAWAEEREICLIVDESFVDFADEADSSLLEQAVLTQYPHLFVMKSISKSYGVPGIRLGILAGDNKEMIAKLKKDVSIWNINSFGEFYLQIYEKYAKDYKAAMDKFRQERRAFVNALAEVRGLRVIPSQANYLLCELTNGESATKLAEDLLDEDNILIKDLSTKKGFEGRNYIRIAIRDEKDNEKLVAALKKKLN